MTDLHFSSAGVSHPGRVRTSNEDAFELGHGVCAVADAVGMRPGGADAAQFVVKACVQELSEDPLPPRQRLEAVFLSIHNRLVERGEAIMQGRPPCVAAVALLLDRDTASIAWVGDCRCYLLRPGTIRLLTHDHSLVADLVHRGEIGEHEAMHHPQRHLIQRALGAGRRRQPNEGGLADIVTVALEPGIAFLLASDGIHTELDAERMRRIAEVHAGDPNGLARALLDSALAMGGHDNLTAVFVSESGYAAQVATLPRTEPMQAEDTIADSLQVATLPPSAVPVPGFLCEQAGRAAPRLRFWSAFASVLALMCAVALGLGTKPAKPGGSSAVILRTAGTAEVPYRTLSEALDAASVGDVLVLEPGVSEVLRPRRRLTVRIEPPGAVSTAQREEDRDANGDL